jgi:small subunit ribosomal protein S18
MKETTPKDTTRPTVHYFDYKDVTTLRTFMNQHGRISGRKHTRLTAAMQHQLARAVKNARFMGLLPYTIV